MATKSGKEKKIPLVKPVEPDMEKGKRASSKSKEEDDIDDDNDKDQKPLKKGKGASKKNDDDDDEDDVVEVQDDWEKPEEEDEWDPDFDEFDVPKSKGKKTPATGKKPAKDEEDDFKIDDDFKDLGFDDLDGGGFDEEDDF